MRKSYTPHYYLDPFQQKQILQLYQEGLSSQEIKDQLNLIQTTRSIQRLVKKHGLMRSMSEAFRLAVSKGRVTYHKNPNTIKRIVLPHKIRYYILTRDGYHCVKCGATAQDSRLQVDHIDENKNNNTLSNLQTLCEECNKGKYRNSIQ